MILEGRKLPTVAAATVGRSEFLLRPPQRPLAGQNSSSGRRGDRWLGANAASGCREDRLHAGMRPKTHPKSFAALISSRRSPRRLFAGHGKSLRSPRQPFRARNDSCGRRGVRSRVEKVPETAAATSRAQEENLAAAAEAFRGSATIPAAAAGILEVWKNWPPAQTAPYSVNSGLVITSVTSVRENRLECRPGERCSSSDCRTRSGTQRRSRAVIS